MTSVSARHRALLALVAIGLLLPGTAAAQQARLSYWDLMTLRAPGGLSLSPDGGWAAYTVSKLDTATMERETHIWLAATDGSAPPRQFTNGASNESSPRFTPDGRHLTFIAARGEAGIRARPS